ncbi:MAG: AraC family transcriptional regulator [Fluviicola sp. XM-24bin1]|nr:MAG: AraC family transcriptional regulator [Fluviicola sp. XM-24bin1]
MKFLGQNDEYIELLTITKENCQVLKTSRKSELTLLWFQSDGNRLKIDTVEYTFNTNDIVSLTEFHQIEVVEIKEVQLLRWARSFYCIIDNDVEVSCKGILFFGSSNVPVIHPQESDLQILKTVFDMFRLEMQSADNLQMEMLQMMLKRILILVTRMYKAQMQLKATDQNNDIIREYNFLVEKHFREKHTVKEYADLLFKSPKTLSNLFKKLGDTSPLQFIHNRIMIEAKRLLTYSDRSISDITYDLGFSDIHVFSRFFKKNEGVSPQNFREGKN